VTVSTGVYQTLDAAPQIGYNAKFELMMIGT
jgi:hypothetical protein